MSVFSGTYFFWQEKKPGNNPVVQKGGQKMSCHYGARGFEIQSACLEKF